jgi:tetratricopeptide (TPR) repeat protein
MLLLEPKEVTMNAFSLLVFLHVVVLSGCASIQSAGEVTQGRQAFLIGNNEVALSYFQNAAQRNPDYIYGTPLSQGVWSYVGRTEYAIGRYPQARQSLERALSANRREDIARLYLGMTLAREGDRQRGLNEIEGGLRGIHGWLEDLSETLRFSTGKFWDPQRQIRSEIQTTLAMISTPGIDWDKIIASGEWVGKTMEAEADRALRAEIFDLSHLSDP